jgi:hypothetical protein
VSGGRKRVNERRVRVIELVVQVALEPLRVRMRGVAFGDLQPHPPRRVAAGEGTENGPEGLCASFSQRFRNRR